MSLESRRALYWTFGLLIGSQLLDAYASLSLLHPLAQPVLSGLWLAGWPLLILAALFWLVRGWGGADTMRRLTMVSLLLWLIASAALSLPAAGPRLLETLRPGSASTLQLSVADAGRTLQLRGRIGFGDAARVDHLLAEHPTLLRVDLASEGGSTPEARAIAARLRERGLSPRLSGACQRDCALIFLSGTVRDIQPEGQLQLQGLRAPSLNPLWGLWLRHAQADLYRAAGLPEDAQLALARIGAPLFSTLDANVLRNAGLQSAAAFALDPRLPPAGGAQVDEYLQALRSHPSWMALERRFPGTLNEAATQLHAAAGESETAVQQAADNLLQPRLAQLLTEASLPMRRDYLELIEQQLAGLQRSEDCRALLTGQLAVRRQLPQLAAREAHWIESASLEGPDADAQRPLNAIEQEVLRRSLGEQVLRDLPQLWPVARRTAVKLDCRAGQALAQQLQQLSPAHRSLALRSLSTRS